MLVVKELPDGSPVRIPYFIVDSKKNGPTTGIVATQHGNEFFSIVVLKEFLKIKYPLKGKIIIFPLANPLAYNVKERTSRIDRKDMNRCWPGKDDGVITEKMCYSIFKILNRCGCVLDLHNGNDNILDTPQARLYEPRCSDVQDLLDHLDVPFILLRKEPLENTLVGCLLDRNIKAITVELGEGRRITYNYINKGIKIIESFLRHTGNLSKPQTFKSIPIDYESGGAGESHPHAPTDPCVNLSIHTAPAGHSLETSRSQAYAERNPVPPSYLVDLHLLRAGSSPSFQPHYRTFNTNTG